LWGVGTSCKSQQACQLPNHLVKVFGKIILTHIFAFNIALRKAEKHSALGAADELW